MHNYQKLKIMDASAIHSKRLNAKEVLAPKENGKIIFPVADGTVQISGEDQVLRTSTSIRGRPDRGEEQGHLRGESDNASNDFWSISGNFIHRHHVDARVKLYVPTEGCES